MAHRTGRHPRNHIIQLPFFIRKDPSDCNSLLTCLAASTHLLYSLFSAQWPGRPDDVSLLLITIQWLTFHTWNKIRIIFRLALHYLASLYFAKHFLTKEKNLPLIF